MSKIEKKASGIMVALYLPQHVAQQVMADGGEPAEDLHVTLCYLPGIGSDKEAFQKIAEALLPVAEEFAPIQGRIGGIGRFNASENSDGKDVYYASFNSPVLPVVQKMVVDAIESNTDLEVSRDHGFTPHVTLKYIGTQDPTPVERKASESFKIPKLSVASREYRMDIPLNGARVLKDSPTGSMVHVPVAGEEQKLKKEADEQDVFKIDFDGSEEDFAPYQRLVEGIDWEGSNNDLDEDSAQAAARANLLVNPDHYRNLFAARDATDDTLQKDDGLNLDLGSGHAREPGFIGFDLYPQDAGTVVHDLTMGIPVGDATSQTIRLVNSLAYMEGLDPQMLLQEVARSLKVGGQFIYEGPERLSEYPSQLEMTDEANNGNNLDGSSNTPWFKQIFKRVEVDPATAQDSYPRLSEASYGDLDAIVAGSALGYYWSDATSSGQANRAYGYPSQGAASSLEEPPKEVTPDDVGKHDQANLQNLEDSFLEFIEEEMTEKMVQKKITFPIAKADKEKQIVYGIVLTPDEVDSQDDYMTSDEIEKAAHSYLVQSRVVGSQHEKPMRKAEVVESYIAPQDMDWEGQYGPQQVKKGAWVLAVKINDKKEWQKVLDGEYQGFSVGGYGVRD